MVGRMPDPPLSLLVKPASALCNLRCGYCFYRKTAGDRAQTRGVMTEATAGLLIEKIFARDPPSVSVVFQGGEPTLAGLGFYSYFVGEVRRKNLRRVPVQYCIQTNGVLIDDDWADFLRRNRFLVGLSLDGDREINDRFRAGKAGESSFDAVLRAADTLRRYAAEFNILAVVTDESAGEAERIYGFFKKQGFGYLQFIPVVDEGCGASLSAENYAVFLKSLFDLWYRDLVNGEYISIRAFDNYINILRGFPPENCGMRGVCGGYFVVESDGALYPCDFYCREEYLLGSITDKDPFALREKHRDFIEKSKIIYGRCRECEYGFLCRGGCRRDRSAELTENRYCAAYKAFFRYAEKRMRAVADGIENG